MKYTRSSRKRDMAGLLAAVLLLRPAFYAPAAEYVPPRETVPVCQTEEVYQSDGELTEEEFFGETEYTDGAYAAETEELSLNEEDSITGDFAVPAVPDKASRKLPLSYLPSAASEDSGSLEGLSELLGAATSSSYDGRGDLPPVRNQGSYSTCWAFAGIAAAEASMIRQGKADSTVDYSELGLAWFMYHSPETDPLGLTTGDKNQLADGYNYLTVGGNAQFGAVTLLGWKGVQEETDIPYEKAATGLTEEDEAKCFDDVAVLEQSLFYNLASNPNLVKEAVMENGAAVISLDVLDSDSCYINAEDQFCIYHPTAAEAGHAASIVGWDDEFSRENFKKPDATKSSADRMPGKDGAWLIRNSWGDGGKAYCWVSYEDKSLGNTAVAMRFVSPETYDHNYYYDGTSGTATNTYTYSYKDKTDGTTKSKTVGTMASGGSAGNIYRSSTESAELLKAVNIGVKTANVRLSVQIYTSSSLPDDPEDGTPMLAEPLEFKTGASGFYCIILPEPVYLGKGVYFSVVAKAVKDGATAIELYTDKNINYTNRGKVFLQMTNVTDGNTSFIKSGTQTGKWSDLKNSRITLSETGEKVSLSSWTVRIKAFTVDCEERKIDPKSLQLKALTVEKGKTAAMKAVILPADASSVTGTEWTISDPAVAAIDAAGNVTGLKRGSAKATCTIIYPGGKLTASADVKVVEYPTSIAFGAEEYRINRNGTRKLALKFEPSGMDTDGLTFDWYCNDTDVLSITGNGTTCTIKGRQEGWATVSVECNEIPGLRTYCDVEVYVSSGPSPTPGPGPGGSAAAKQAAGTYSPNWTTDAGGNWIIKNGKGEIVKNAWLCDDVITANGQNVWYLLNTDGTMVTAGLVQDNTGSFYSLETEHNGYFGMLRYKNGTYNCGGQQVYLEFSQKHDGTFGAIINADGLAKLQAIYGITRFGVDNSNCVYTKSF